MRRRRECQRCRRRFTTYEFLENVPREIIGRDGRRSAYDRPKLRLSLERVLDVVREKEVIDAVVEATEEWLMEMPADVSAGAVADYVKGQLCRARQPVAAVLYASYVERFTQAQQFVEEAERMVRAGRVVR